MPAAGRYGQARIGGGPLVRSLVLNGGLNTYALPAVNNGWCARVVADTTRDIKAVNLMWATVATPGQVSLRIELIDATTRKPSGTLYDANASLTFTPNAGGTGWQTLTFATLPTTGLTLGNEYGVLLLTTSAGTTHTLRSHLAELNLPATVLTATNGATRSNFAEVANSTPLLTLVYEDDAEETPPGCIPYGAQVSHPIYGTRAASLKLSVAGTIHVVGLETDTLTRNGTPSDLRVRIFSAADGTLAGAARTTHVTSLAGITSFKRFQCFFDQPITLGVGTYRAVIDQTNHASTAGNNWTVYRAQARIAALNPSGAIWSTTADLDAAPIVWTDTAADQPAFSLLVADVPAGGGGGGVFILNE